MFNTTRLITRVHFKWISVKTFLGVCFANEKYLRSFTFINFFKILSILRVIDEHERLQTMSPSIKVYG